MFGEGQRIDGSEVKIIVQKHTVEIEKILPGYHHDGQCQSHRIEGIAADAAKDLLADHDGDKGPGDHRAVAAADSTRGLPPRTVGLLPGQMVLTVPDMVVKRQAHIKGLGVGYMPKHLVIDDLESGRLIVKATEDNQSSETIIYYAWRSNHQGKALAWFKQQLCDEARPFEWFGESSKTIDNSLE